MEVGELCFSLFSTPGVMESILSGAAFSSPAKRYKIDRKKIVMDDFDTEALRSTVHEFYSEKKYLTIDSLL